VVECRRLPAAPRPPPRTRRPPWGGPSTPARTQPPAPPATRAPCPPCSASAHPTPTVMSLTRPPPESSTAQWQLLPEEQSPLWPHQCRPMLCVCPSSGSPVADLGHELWYDRSGSRSGSCPSLVHQLLQAATTEQDRVEAEPLIAPESSSHSASSVEAVSGRSSDSEALVSTGSKG